MDNKFVKINGIEYLVYYEKTEFWEDASFSHDYGVHHGQLIARIEFNIVSVYHEGDQVPLTPEFEKEIIDYLSE